MAFRLAVIGHSSSIGELETIVRDKFQNIEVTGIPLSSDEEADRAAQQLEAHMADCNGILYTRRDPYELLVKRVDHGSIPTRYVDIDASSFIHSLLKASCHNHQDICHVSVDTLSIEVVTQAYESLDIECAAVRLVGVDPSSEHFVQAVAQIHRENYHSGQCTLCVTNIRSVCDILLAEGVPIALMAPSQDTYINEIRRLLVSHQMKQSTENRLAALSLTATAASEEQMQKSSAVQGVMEHNRISELVAYFAQRIGGVYFRISSNQFFILCDYRELMEETNNLSNIELLANVYLHTAYAMSIGIGVGVNVQNLYSNAQIGERRALRENGNRAYVVYSPNEMLGPIEPNEVRQPSNSLFDQRFVLISETCGLSINTVFKIDSYIRQKPNRSFVSSELAEELEVSGRTANRIVTRLERKGYIMEIGRSITGEKGRPTRVFRAMW